MRYGRLAAIGCCAVVYLLGVYGCGGGGGDGGSSPSSTQSSGPPRDLPPDPGPAGAVTVQGVDSNTNAIRDDVERYINTTYQSSERTVRSLNQYARVLQQSMAPTSTQEALAIDQNLARAVRCVASLANPPSSKSVSYMLNDVLASQLNTKARMLAYAAYADNLAGKVVVVDFSTNPCDFDPAVLPN